MFFVFKNSVIVNKNEQKKEKKTNLALTSFCLINTHHLFVCRVSARCVLIVCVSDSYTLTHTHTHRVQPIYHNMLYLKSKYLTSG